ncbi:hypothetical protein HMPREF9603_02028 [Cutibacterium acnes HL001PA1]|nr:hypothetical protein HMPREF9603_02028 [Cutibacterium acnes HL001PA1]EGF03117.1 hypothetical protein HMPREF9586_00839 [Cutibacterium acnes HL083PA2]
MTAGRCSSGGSTSTLDVPCGDPNVPGSSSSRGVGWSPGRLRVAIRLVQGARAIQDLYATVPERDCHSGRVLRVCCRLDMVSCAVTGLMQS